MEINRKYIQVYYEGMYDDYGHNEFIDFLKDHRLTLKKVTTDLNSIHDWQLRDMLSCLPHGTHISRHQGS